MVRILRRKRIPLVAAAMVTSLALLVPASPAHAGGELVVPLSEPEASVETTDIPVDARVVSALVTLGGSDPVPIGVESKVDDPLGSIPVGDALGQTCKQVWVRIDYKNARGDTIMYFKQTKDWCWNNSTQNITSVGVVASGHVYAWADPVWNYDGVISQTNFYYNGGKSHYSFREGKFSAHCGPWSCGSKTPEIIIRAHGGGRWTYWTRG
jgi:hypothetical protein